MVLYVGIVIADFEAETAEEISVKEGEQVEVLSREDDGWCIVRYNDAQGVFPESYLEALEEEDEGEDAEEEPSVAPPPEEPGLSKEEQEARYRSNIIKEIIITEKDYVQDLQIISDVFIKPLASKALLSPQDSSLLFSNIEVLLSVNHQLNDRVSSFPDPDSMMVGGIFLEMADFLKMYTVYCANQPNSMSCLDRLSKQSAFKGFLAECLENPVCRGLTLFSFLIKPIQRICKYPLLLRDLLRHTEETHPDYNDLKLALGKIEEVVAYVNERKRLAENLQKILDVQNLIESNEELNLVSPTRRFVKEGALVVIEKGKRHERNAYLFNDLIVLTKPATKTMMGSTVKDQFRAQLSLNQARIVDVADTDEIKFACELRPLNADSKIVIVFPTNEEKNKWVKDIKTLVKEFQLRQLKAKKDGTFTEPSQETTPPPDQKSSKSRRLNPLKKNSSSAQIKGGPPPSPPVGKKPAPEPKKSEPKKPAPIPPGSGRTPPQPSRAAGKIKVDRKVQTMFLSTPSPLGGPAPVKPSKSKTKSKDKDKSKAKPSGSVATGTPPRIHLSSDFAAQLNQAVGARKAPQ